MALQLTRKIEVKLAQSFSHRVFRKAVSRAIKNLRLAQPAIVEVTRELVAQAIINSPVYKGLSGKFPGDFYSGDDLQAEFGLTSNGASSALDKLVEIVVSSINDKNMLLIPFDDKVRVVLKNPMNPQEYEPRLVADSSFTVRSKNSKGEITPIRWMEWLLDAKPKIVEQYLSNIVDYAITYDLSAKEKTFSRSKRALMVRRDRELKRKTTRFYRYPYVLPKIALPKVKGSRNFIEDIAKSRQFKKALTDAIEKKLYQVFKSGKLPDRLR